MVTVGVGDVLTLGVGLGEADVAALGVVDGDGPVPVLLRVATQRPSPIRPTRSRIARPMRIGAHHVRGGWSGTHCCSGAGWRGPPTGTPARAAHRAGACSGPTAGGMTDVLSVGGRSNRSVSAPGRGSPSAGGCSSVGRSSATLP